MKAKTIIALATLLAFGQGAWAQDPATIGSITYNSEKGYYPISSVENLNDLAVYVNGSGIYSNSTTETTAHDCEGKTFKMTGNITFTAPVSPETSNFTPIGIMVEYNGSMIGDKGFKGTFDGDGYTISGITVKDDDGEAIGLFGNALHPSIIKNVKIASSSFTGNYCVGAIVGEYNGSSNHATEYGIYNCEVASTVTVAAATMGEGDEAVPGWNAGGIVGDLKLGQAVGCISAAKVSADEYVGGIAGSISSSKSTYGDYDGILTNCFYTGNSVNGAEGAKYVGTVVGLNGELDEDDNFKTGSEGTINLTLYDADGDAIDNATRLGYYNGIENVNVTLSGRTLYKDNSWNTVCLPFAMTAAQVTAQLAPTKLMTLSTATFAEGTLTLNFADATEIVAGKPYIIKWASGDDFTPTFEGVTVSSAAPTDVAGTAANFHGIYTPYSTGGENKSMLYLGASNKLYYPNDNMTINAFRAYFTLNNGIEAGSAPAAARAFVLNFGDGDGATGILSLSADSKDSEDNAAWYDMQGRRLSGKPTASGIYINNGNKIVIK